MRFAEGEFYHIYNRGVDGREIFLKTSDYQRFLDGLLAFNTNCPVTLREFDYGAKIAKNDKLCSLICYVLMKNHVHFVVRCANPENLSKYLQKVFIGYTAFFNEKYRRIGVLFQGGSKSQHIDSDRYIRHIVDYVHLNPLDYFIPEWRNHGVVSIKVAKNKLLDYQYSSLSAFIGTESNSALDFDIIREIFPNPKEVLNSMLEWSTSSLENSDIAWEG